MKFRIINIAVFILSISAESSFAQHSAASRQIITFRLSNPLPVYSVYPNDSVLYAGEKHKITIKKNGRKKSIKLFMEDCKISGKDSIYYLIPDSARQSVLCLYEKQVSGKNRLRYSKVYTFKIIKEPYAMVAGVKSDSAVEKLQMMSENTIKAYWQHYHQWLKVVSFSIDVPSDTSFITLHTTGNKFDLEMRRELFKMKDGDVIYIHTINAQLPDGRKKIIAPMTLYINEKDKFRDKVIMGRGR